MLPLSFGDFSDSRNVVCALNFFFFKKHKLHVNNTVFVLFCIQTFSCKRCAARTLTQSWHIKLTLYFVAFFCLFGYNVSVSKNGSTVLRVVLLLLNYFYLLRFVDVGFALLDTVCFRNNVYLLIISYFL